MGITNMAKAAVVTSVRAAHLFMRLPVHPLAQALDSEFLLRQSRTRQKPFRLSSTVTFFGSSELVLGEKAAALRC
jgi:hypothetical protein